MRKLKLPLPRGLAAALLILLSGCSGQMRNKYAEPASVSRFPQDLARPALQASGISEDGWTAATATLNLAQPAAGHVLAIRGMVPRIDNDRFRTEVRVAVDGRSVGQEPLGTGEFALEIPTGGQPGPHRVALSFSETQKLPGGDGRSVGAKLAFVGFQAVAGKHAGSEIVRRGSGIRLGPEWGPLEIFKGETFRWVGNDASIFVTGLQTGDRRFTITAEPGPGLDRKPLLLKVTDASGRQIDAVEFTGRGSTDVFVPVEAGKEAEFRLHVDGGGKTIPSDPRILNFRVFGIVAR
jgi:hypothetical protein